MGAMASATWAQGSEQAREEAAHIVVVVRCQFGSEDPEIGAGIIVGKGNDRLYVATANHVVRHGKQEAANIRIQLRSLPGDPVPAKLLADFDAKKDLAVLTIVGLSEHGLNKLMLPFDRLGDAAAIHRGDPVFSLGHPQGKKWAVNVLPDPVSSGDATTLTFQSSYVTAGHSGGALLNDRSEIVGLLLKVQPPEATARRMDDVLQQLRNWGYPVSLRRRFASSLETISAGAGFTCWVGPKSSTWCWGSNSDGQLGSGTRVDSAKPMPVQGRLSFVSVSAGWGFACGVTTDGIVYCWGGDGEQPTPVVESRVPVRVASDLKFASVSAAFDHVCALTVEGRAYCWGGNDGGQLGNGKTQASSSPVAVAGGIQFKSISAGLSHTCGVAADDRGFCWGSNESGELGNGSTRPSRVPVEVVGKTRFMAIRAGTIYTCGLATTGMDFCWGTNRDEQLGDGTKLDRNRPVAIVGQKRFRSVSTNPLGGGSTNCALDVSGRAHCWGRLGFEVAGGAEWKNGPGPIVGDVLFSQISANIWSHVCGVGLDGNVYCWGSNRYGQLGDGWTDDRLRPDLVPLPP
jgi:alpha-tubulin suppressor-like RCC1 family protein